MRETSLIIKKYVFPAKNDKYRTISLTNKVHIRLTRTMILFWIILILESHVFTQATSTQGPVMLAAQESSTIQTEIIGQSASPGATPEVSASPALQDLTLTNSLTVLGDALFGKTSIAGGLTVDGSLSLSHSDLTTLTDTLYIEQNKMAPIDMMGGALRIDTNGLVSIGQLDITGILGVSTIQPLSGDITVNLASGSPSAGFGNLILKGNIIASGTGTFAEVTAPTVRTSRLIVSASGKGTIPPGFSTMKISTAAINTASQVFVTPVSLTTLPISVTRVTPATVSAEGSFTVETAEPVSRDLNFNWFIIN